MKADKIKRRERLNWLSREASADVSEINRSVKIGNSSRGGERAANWARWMLESRHGVTVPEDAVLLRSDVSDYFGAYVFVMETEVRGWWERISTSSQGLPAPIWHPATVVREPVTASFEIPPWCRPVRFADNWHACHQAGLSMGACERSASRSSPPRCLDASDAEPSLVPSDSSPRTAYSHEAPSDGRLEPYAAASPQTTCAPPALPPCAPVSNASVVRLEDYRAAGVSCYGRPIWLVSFDGPSS